MIFPQNGLGQTIKSNQSSYVVMCLRIGFFSDLVLPKVMKMKRGREVVRVAQEKTTQHKTNNTKRLGLGFPKRLI